jgi:hypothetical protein
VDFLGKRNGVDLSFPFQSGCPLSLSATCKHTDPSATYHLIFTFGC